jgi:ketosteroid isomerase-like protein
MHNVELMKRVWGPVERGESDDLRPFWDSLADDVVLTTSAGELRGKDAIQRYFAIAAETIDFNPFVKPLEYFGDGDRVVISGEETFTVRQTGATHHAAWVWLVDVHDGLTTRITSVQDLSGVGELIAAAMSRARS